MRGHARDLLIDTGLGHVSRRDYVALVSECSLVCVASSTHFDHIGCDHEFSEPCVHTAEAAILADPRIEWTLADRCAADEMFDRLPKAGQPSATRSCPARAHRLLADREVLDLGGRSFEVVHTPGIGLFEHATGIFLSSTSSMTAR